MNYINETQVEGAVNPQAATKTNSRKEGSMPHNLVLIKLLEQVEQVDFHKEAFVRANSDDDVQTTFSGLNQTDAKLKNQHFLIITIEKLLQLAEENSWGLCKHQGQVYVYNGEYWSSIDTDDLQRFLGQVALKMGVGKYYASYYQFQQNLVKQFFASAHLSAPATNENVVRVNLRNCTLEIIPEKMNGELKLTLNQKPFDRNDFMTYQLPFDYAPDAQADKFTKYLNEVLPDADSRNVLAEFIGYLFVSTKTLKLEKALLLYGSGANGKSVFFEIITSLLGSDNVSNYTLQSLTNENGYYRAKIVDVLVNYASEINCKLDNAVFKALVSGEPVEARLPYAPPFKAERYGKLIFNCNELPKDVEHSNAYFRRFLIIPFEVTIPPQQPNQRPARPDCCRRTVRHI